MSLLVISVCAVCVGLLLVAEQAGADRLKWAAKPAASLCFIALAVVCGAASSGPYGALILTGLILCAVGDVFLIAKREPMFLAGMGAFALGHLAYAGAFMATGLTLKPGLVAAAAVMAASAAATLYSLRGRLGAMRVPVIAYMAIISAMVVLSVAATGPGGGYFALAVAGAFGFALSDIAVARDQFLKPALANKLWGLPLYYGAQGLLALSVQA